MSQTWDQEERDFILNKLKTTKLFNESYIVFQTLKVHDEFKSWGIEINNYMVLLF